LRNFILESKTLTNQKLQSELRNFIHESKTLTNQWLPQSEGGGGSGGCNVGGGGELCNVENQILMAVADMVGSVWFYNRKLLF
jgi:hypothetical protein